MNIIEAIQQAESGKLISNNSLFGKNYYIEYKGEGNFRGHRVIADDKTVPVDTFQKFTMAHILSIDWKIVHSLKFNNQ